jgi:hypothetical protein
MKFKIQLTVVSEDDREESVKEIMILNKDSQQIEHIGLTLAESKEVLKQLQTYIIKEQVESFLEANKYCPHCRTKHKIKGYHTITFRTLFGDIELDSPQWYHCPCRPQKTVTFSPLTSLLPEHTSPELLFIETKWASLVSYGMTLQALQDFLPINEKLNEATVRNHTMEVAQRCEAELGDEQVFFIDGCPRDWQALPPPESPITVGMDGGYVRGWENKKTNFEVIVGKSIPTEGSAKCFGFVQGYDQKPKRRVFEVLKSQGMQMNQEVYFMSDGEEAVRQVQLYLNPQAEHILDWFHITMRITGLGQFIKGLIHLDPELGDQIQKALKSTKWNLWHGKVEAALDQFLDVEMLMYNFEETYPKFKALEKAVYEFKGYIERNAGMIRNYGKYWREGRVISTAFVESLVNSLVSKRFVKKQQMQWTRKGAHLLLQMRTKVMNQELAATFRKWYPNFQVESDRAA